MSPGDGLSQLLTRLNVRAALEERGAAVNRREVAGSLERDVMLTAILRDARSPVVERIKAIHELNKVEGCHLHRHQVTGRITLEEAIEASRRLDVEL